MVKSLPGRQGNEYRTISVPVYRLRNYYCNIIMVLRGDGGKHRSEKNHAYRSGTLCFGDHWLRWIRGKRFKFPRDGNYLCDPRLRLSAFCLFIPGMDRICQSSGKARPGCRLVLVHLYRWPECTGYLLFHLGNKTPREHQYFMEFTYLGSDRRIICYYNQ